MIETLALSLALFLPLYVVRGHWRLIRGVWRESTRLERCALVLALAPLPGPFEEIMGALVIRRVLRRRRAAAATR